MDRSTILIIAYIIIIPLVAIALLLWDKTMLDVDDKNDWVIVGLMAWLWPAAPFVFISFGIGWLSSQIVKAITKR